MTKQKKFGEFTIHLGQTERNALKLLAAKYSLNHSQVVTMALDEHYRKKLNREEKECIDDVEHCNYLIGNYINTNRGVWGYDPEVNDIPDSKKHMLIEEHYDTMDVCTGAETLPKPTYITVDGE